MKFQHNKIKLEPKRVSSSDTIPGDLMVVVKDSYKGTILLHVYDHFVDINDPSLTWNENVDFPVRMFLPGESVTLTQE